MDANNYRTCPKCGRQGFTRPRLIRGCGHGYGGGDLLESVCFTCGYKATEKARDAR